MLQTTNYKLTVVHNIKEYSFFFLANAIFHYHRLEPYSTFSFENSITKIPESAKCSVGNRTYTFSRTQSEKKRRWEQNIFKFREYEAWNGSTDNIWRSRKRTCITLVFFFHYLVYPDLPKLKVLPSFSLPLWKTPFPCRINSIELGNIFFSSLAR